ncbi:hypothetical protein LP414_27190 [Polaromonas sp. P1(28)-13]|nr:hypothetical protein LP414_27190 [Polaromonas sp. P1(28)-13]
MDMNYGLRPMQFSEVNASDEEGDPFVETLASDTLTPEEALEFKQSWIAATANLSPLALLIVEWLRDPPPELVAELSKKLAHADKCETAGVRAYGLRDGLSISSVTKFMAMVTPEMKPEEAALAKSELVEMVKQLEMQE